MTRFDPINGSGIDARVGNPLRKVTTYCSRDVIYGDGKEAMQARNYNIGLNAIANVHVGVRCLLRDYATR